MTLAPGTVLGPYEIAGQIGAGGMGEVYRARDTKLERDVALKILPDAFTGDPERIARFQLEAKVLASLNHPNIAAIYGLEDGEATRALVLELVEGPTLADRIAQGPIPVDEALRIAQQIAEALEAAHEQGIVHRDLKPANIKLRPDGTVKVLDFGLAKALEGERTQAEQSNSPTLTAAASQMGVIMGTAAYMSPEQARGKPADRRADIWAFGVVLFEMLTGQRAFEGEDASLTLADVMRAEPKWERLPDGFSPGLHTYLRRCLNKDPKQRVQAIGDVRLAMEGAFESMAARPPDVIAGRAQPAPWQHPGTIAAMLLATAVLTGLGVRTLSPPAAAPFTRTSIVLPRTQVTDSRSRGVAISPDGTHISYAANGQLYLRALDQLDSVPLTGSEERGATSPFFSPDGQWIGFFSVGSLKKVPLSGGAAVTVAELNAGFNVSATWGVNDTIVVSAGLRVFRVAGTGGPLEELLAVEPPAFVRQPQILPGGEALLYTFDDFAGAGYWEASEIVVRNLATGERTVLVEGGTDARYLSTGHLVYSLGSTLFAVPFDPDRLELTGGPVPLVEGVNRTGTGATNADISQTGTLVYLPGGDEAGFSPSTLVWVDREGREEVVPAPPHAYLSPRLSPDGARLAVSTIDGEQDLWVWEFARATLTRLTFTPVAEYIGLWTPDGDRIVYDSGILGTTDLYWRAADGSGAAERLTDSPDIATFAQTLSPDGTKLVYWERLMNEGAELHLLSLDDGRRSEPLIVTEFSNVNAEISPDGRWLAYQSDSSGQWEIYVQPFPNVDDGKWQISTTGGVQPAWGPDGRELFYRSNSDLMGVVVETDPGFALGTPVPIIADRYFVGVSRSYDIAPDGQRFLMIKEGGASAEDADGPFAGLTRIHVVSNWFEELKARVPAER